MPLPADGLKLPEECCDLWIVDLEPVTAWAEYLKEHLIQAELEHYHRFSNREAQSSFLASRAFLRLLASSYLQTDPKTLKISTQAHGKPWLADFPDFHFNISHSRARLALLFARVPCGVDLEFTGRQVDYQQILSRFFAAEEIATMQGQPDERLAFFRGWTRKEAYLKATGEGIAGLGKIAISFAPDLPHPIISGKGPIKAGGNWFFREFSPGDGYLGATAIFAETEPQLQLYSISNIEELFPEPAR